MTQEDKEILLKVLSEQLPYGVLILDTAAEKYGKLYQINSDSVWYDCQETGDVEYQTIFNVKPYLRPMSSMTEEEKIEYNKYINYRFSNEKDGMVANVFVFVDDAPDYIDWLNAHHLDYRGLIPMGLTLEAKEGMYSI